MKYRSVPTVKLRPAFAPSQPRSCNNRPGPRRRAANAMPVHWRRGHAQKRSNGRPSTPLAGRLHRLQGLQIRTAHCKISWFPLLTARRKLAGSGYQDLWGVDGRADFRQFRRRASFCHACEQAPSDRAAALCDDDHDLFRLMALFAFDKPLLGTVLAPGLSLCIVLGPLVIVSSFLLCLIYVLWANRVFDVSLRDLER